MKKVMLAVLVAVCGAAVAFGQVFSDFDLRVNGSGDGLIVTGYRGPSTDLIIPATIDGLPVTEIANNAFARNLAIISVQIPQTVRRIGSGVFAGCRNLVRVGIPPSVREFEDAVFKDCENLLDFSFPPFVESVPREMFAGCVRLRQVRLNPGLTRIGDSAFAGTKALARIELPEGLTHIDSGAFGHSGLTDLFLPDSVVAIAYHAFASSNIRKVQFPNNNRLTVGEAAFAQCGNLTSVIIPETVSTIAFEARNRSHVPFYLVSLNSASQVALRRVGYRWDL